MVFPRTLSVVGVLLTALSGCGRLSDRTERSDRREGIDPRPEVLAEADMGRYFLLDQATDRASGQAIGLRKQGLDREFLLQSSLIVQTLAPQWMGNRSRVVAFRRDGDSVFMLEATQGHNLTPDLPQHLLLAEFPIVRETGDALYFDFNAGMSRIFVGEEWAASDFSGPWYQPQFAALDVNVSYVEAAAFDAQRSLTIDQIAHLDLEGGLPLRVRYYFSAYRPDPTYVPAAKADFDRVGYFEVSPQLPVSRGADVIRATRFHQDRPIVFAMSANTPEDFRAAVRDGILYWNKVFGTERVQVVEAPAGVTAPDPRYNMVQWVDFADAGFAYADAQMDPRSGEILHAQVYMTSAFAVYGLEDARALLRDQAAAFGGPGRTQGTKVRKIGLKGFTTEPMCSHAADEAWLSALSSLVEARADDAFVRKAAQNYVREVVAHEIGHTLGLRHNFAGSLAANYTADTRPEVIKRWIAAGGDALPDVVTTSSVMEYQLFEEGALTGAAIAAGHPGLAYDRYAINALYQPDGAGKDAAGPLFCTDSHLFFGNFLDCNIFDAGSSAPAWSAARRAQVRDGLGGRILESYIAAVKSPPPGWEAMKPEAFSLSPAVLADFYLSGPVYGLARLMSEDTNFLGVQRQFVKVHDQNRAQVKAREADYLAGELKRLGGLEALIATVPEAEVVAAVAKVKSLARSSAYRTGVGPGGAYELTSADLAVLDGIADDLAARLPDLALRADLKRLGQPLTNLRADSGLAESVVGRLTAVANDVVRAATGSTSLVLPILVDGAGDKRDVSLPVYKWSTDTRRTAASLLADKRMAADEVTLVARLGAQAGFVEQAETALGQTLDTELLLDSPREAVRWVLDQRLVRDAFTTSAADGE